MWGCSSWTTAQHLTLLFQTFSSPNYWNYRSPSPPAIGLETSCQVTHSLWDSAPTTPMHSRSALVPLKAAFWALYCTPCTPSTAHQLTQPTTLLNMQMTPQWLDSSVVRRRQRTGPRWRNCCYGAQTTTWPWMSKRPKNSSWTSGRTDMTTPPLINGEQVETVTTFRYLGTQTTPGPTTLVKKAQQWLHFLRVLRKNKLDTKLLLAFYHSSVESVLTYCLGVWYAGSTAKDKKAVQRVINTAQKIIGCLLTSLEHIATSCCLRRTKAITGDPSHPAYPLFDLLPSGRRYRSTKSHTSRLTDSFFPWAIRTTNTNG